MRAASYLKTLVVRHVSTVQSGTNQGLRWRSQIEPPKSIWGDKINVEQHKTLLNRLLQHLNVTKPVKLNADTSIQTLHNLAKGNVSVLQSLNVDQLANIFYTAADCARTIKPNDIHKLQRAVRLLDVECSLRLNSFDLSGVLTLLAAFMHISPNRITETKFYRYFLDNINFEHYVKIASKDELLRLIFYIGLEKQNKKVHSDLRKCLERVNRDYLDKLTIEEMCVICNSTYRTNFRITNSAILEKVKQMLQENLYLLKDASFFVTLAKTIKSHRCEDSDLLSSISCTIFFNKTMQHYDFGVTCHIMSLFADTFYCDVNLLKLFSEKCFSELKSADCNVRSRHVSEIIRAKDINRFLWILGVLYYDDVAENMIEEIVLPQIRERIKLGEFKKQPELLITSILYLWMMNYRAKDLLPPALTAENLKQISANAMNNCRLDLLLTAIKLEDPTLFSTLGINPSIKCLHYNNSTSQMNQRPLLKKVHKILNDMASQLQLQKFELEFQVSHLNILGITGYNTSTKAVNVEILDEYTSLQNTEEVSANGFQNLKSRILENSTEPLLIIRSKDVEEMPEEELRHFLSEELKLIL